MTANVITAIIEEFENNNYEPTTWAIRAHHDGWGEFEYVTPEVGGEIENSYVWADGEATSEQLDGVCALEINDLETALAATAIYPARNYILLAVDSYAHGEDQGEIICQDYEIVAVW